MYYILHVNNGDLMMCDFDESMLSDMHRDAYGFRPTTGWWDCWNHQNLEGKRAAFRTLCDDLERAIEREKAEKDRAVTAFEAEVLKFISYGAADRETAIRWMTENEFFEHSQDIEHWVWQKGLLFTNLGKTLIAQLMGIHRVPF